MLKTIVSKSPATIISKATSSAIRSTSSSAATVTSSMLADSTDFFNHLSSETEKEHIAAGSATADGNMTNQLSGMISRSSNNNNSNPSSSGSAAAIGYAVVDEDALLQDFFVNMIDSETRSSLPPPNTTFMRAAAATAAANRNANNTQVHHRRSGMKAQEKAEAKRIRHEDRTKYNVTIPGMETITFEPGNAEKTRANLSAALFNNNNNSSNSTLLPVGSDIIEAKESTQEVKTSEMTTEQETKLEAALLLVSVETPSAVVEAPQVVQLEATQVDEGQLTVLPSDEEVLQLVHERSTSPEIQTVVVDDLESAAMLEHQTLDATDERREDSTMQPQDIETTKSLQQRLVEEDELLLEKRSASQDRRDEEATALVDQVEVEVLESPSSSAIVAEPIADAVLQSQPQQQQQQQDELIVAASSEAEQQEATVAEISAPSEFQQQEIEVKSEDPEHHEQIEFVASSEPIIYETQLETQEELSPFAENTAKESQQDEYDNNDNNNDDDFYMYEEQPQQVEIKHQQEIKNVQRVTNEEEAHDEEISAKESVLDSLQRSLEFFTLATKSTATTTTFTPEYEYQQISYPDQQVSLSAATMTQQLPSPKTSTAASRKPLTPKEEQQLFSRIPVTKREILSQISRQTTFYMKRASTSLLSRLKEADKLLKGLRKEKLLLSQQRTKMRNVLRGLEKQVEKLEQRAVKQQKMLAEINAQIKQNRLLKVMQTCAKTKKITADVLNDRLLPSAHFVDLVAERIAERHHIPEIFGGSNFNAAISEAQNHQLIDDKNDHEEFELISSVTKRQEKLQQQIEDQLKELQKTLSEAADTSNIVEADDNSVDHDGAGDAEINEDYSSSISEASNMMILQEQRTLATHAELAAAAAAAAAQQHACKITNEDLFVQLMDEKISSYHLEELIDRGIDSYRANTGLFSDDDNDSNNNDDDDDDVDQVEEKTAHQKQKEEQQVSVTKSNVRMPDIVFIPTMSRKTVVAPAASPTF